MRREVEHRKRAHDSKRHCLIFWSIIRMFAKRFSCWPCVVGTPSGNEHNANHQRFPRKNWPGNLFIAARRGEITSRLRGFRLRRPARLNQLPNLTPLLHVAHDQIKQRGARRDVALERNGHSQRVEQLGDSGG